MDNKSNNTAGKKNINASQNSKGKRNFDKKSKRSASTRTNRPQRDESVKTTAGQRSNSPDWYKIDDNIMKGVASYPFSRRVGDEATILGNFCTLNATGGFTNTSANTDIPSPGVMTIEWIPSIGIATSPTDPINQIAQRVYNYVRHANSGSSAYDASDLMMYILSVTSCYNWWCALRRVYGVLQWASPMNRYLPEALVRAMGFNYKELSTHATRLLDIINFMAIRMKSFCIPAGMTAVIRQAWLNSNVFADGMEEKAQFYVPVQRGFYVLRENFSLGTPGLLEAKSPWYQATTGLTFDYIEKFTNDLIQPLLTSEDFMTMGGDIRKAFGVQNLFWLESTSMDYTVLPDFNPEVLYQIENAFTPFVDDPVETFINKFQITQDPNTNTITSTLKITQATDMSVVTVSSALVNVPMDAPTPEDVTVATRLITLAKTGPQDGIVSITTGGSELVTGYRLYNLPNSASLTLDSKSFYFANYIPYTTSPIYEETYRKLSAITAFNHHPVIYVGMPVDNGTKWTGPLTNLRNWTVIKGEDLQRINTMCLYAEYNVPSMQD